MMMLLLLLLLLLLRSGLVCLLIMDSVFFSFVFCLDVGCCADGSDGRSGLVPFRVEGILGRVRFFSSLHVIFLPAACFSHMILLLQSWLCCLTHSCVVSPFRCGHRGGFAELVNFDAGAMAEYYKLSSVGLCSNLAGQTVVCT